MTSKLSEYLLEKLISQWSEVKRINKLVQEISVVQLQSQTMTDDFHAQFANHIEESATYIVNLRIHIFNEPYSHWIKRILS